MVKNTFLSIFLIVLIGCSSSNIQSTRLPAQSLHCTDELSDLVLEDHRLWRNYQLKDYEGLSSSFIDESPELLKLVELHAFEEQKEHSRLIMALIAHNHPEFDAQAIASRYARLYKECPKS